MSELYPGSEQIPAMLVSKCPDDWKEKLDSGDYIGTQKQDGYWYELEKTADGRVYLFSRSKSKKTGELSEKIENVPHLKEWAKKELPCDTILIGEIYYPGKTSKDVTKIMGSLPEKAISRQCDSDEYGGLIHYYIHDVIKWQGQDLKNTCYIDRLVFLLNISGNYISNKYKDVIVVADAYYENLHQWLHWIFENGGEGMVFRKKDSIYKPGKRPKEVFKIKTEETFDVVIMDFVDPVMEYSGKEIETWPYWAEKTEIDIDGNVSWTLWPIEEGKEKGYSNYQLNPNWYMPVTKAYYYGWKAGFIAGLYNNDGVLCPVGNITSGMTDYLREDMANNPHIYLEMVAEVQAMSVDPNELSLRHGRLKALRPDKDSEECTIESVFK